MIAKPVQTSTAPAGFRVGDERLVKLTENAGRKVTSLLAKQGRTNGVLRVAVVGGGCSGLQYKMDLQLEAITGKESRSVLLGHLQRGGCPTSVDRLLATRFGTRAMELVLARNWGMMVALQPPDIVAVPLAAVAGKIRTVPVDGDLIRTARAMGVGFGD